MLRFVAWESVRVQMWSRGTCKSFVSQRSKLRASSTAALRFQMFPAWYLSTPIRIANTCPDMACRDGLSKRREGLACDLR